jgi:hypothetical protein
MMTLSAPDGFDVTVAQQRKKKKAHPFFLSAFFLKQVLKTLTSSRFFFFGSFFLLYRGGGHPWGRTGRFRFSTPNWLALSLLFSLSDLNDGRRDGWSERE